MLARTALGKYLSDTVMSMLRCINPLREPGCDMLTSAAVGVVFVPWGVLRLRGEEMKAPVEDVHAGEGGRASGDELFVRRGVSWLELGLKGIEGVRRVGGLGLSCPGKGIGARSSEKAGDVVPVALGVLVSKSNARSFGPVWRQPIMRSRAAHQSIIVRLHGFVGGGRHGIDRNRDGDGYEAEDHQYQNEPELKSEQNRNETEETKLTGFNRIRHPRKLRPEDPTRPLQIRIRTSTLHLTHRYQYPSSPSPSSTAGPPSTDRAHRSSSGTRYKSWPVFSATRCMVAAEMESIVVFPLAS